jgi:hypothetical protein
MANTDRPVNIVSLLAIVVVAVAAPASAHPEFAPNTVNRYVKCDLVSPTEIRLAYTIMVGATPAAAQRRAADADGNGKVDGNESRAIGEKLRAATVAGVTLEVDGAKVTPAFAAPDVGLAGDDVAPSPLSVDLVARVPLAAAATHTVRFDDATPEPLLGETEVRIDESPTTRLIAAHRGPTGDERETKFLFRGPKFSALEDRSITFVFRPGAHTAAPVAAAPPTRRPPRLGSRVVSFVVFFGLAALFAMTFVRTHRRRQRR